MVRHDGTAARWQSVEPLDHGLDTQDLLDVLSLDIRQRLERLDRAPERAPEEEVVLALLENAAEPARALLGRGP